MMNRLGLCGLLLCGPLACSGGSDGDESRGELGKAGLHWEDGSLTFRTEPFTVRPSQERYLCWAINTEQDLEVSTVKFGGAPLVHHLLLSRTLVPEPDGWSECPNLLKTTWMPIFAAGAGANELRLPAGVAHQIAAGSQLVVQLHLLNATKNAVIDVAELTMEPSHQANVESVQIGGFGSFQIALPPHRASSVTAECALTQRSRMVALMPHMHRLGKSLRLELGKGPSDLQVIYAREPWDFDQQTIDNFDLTVEPGQYARVTCNYDNTTDQTITYGESTLDEMCFLGAFWVGIPNNCVTF